MTPEGQLGEDGAEGDDVLVVAALLLDGGGDHVAHGGERVEREGVGVGERLEVDAHVDLGDVGAVGGVGAEAARHGLVVDAALGAHEAAAGEAVLDCRRLGSLLTVLERDAEHADGNVNHRWSPSSVRTP